MPLFHGQRDASLINKLTTELIVDIVDTEVGLYKLSIQDTKTNIYNESDRKVYYAPIKIPALIEYQPKNYEGTDFGQDYTQLCTFAFIREFLKEIRTLIEVGDAIEYNGIFIGAGYSVSIIANSHLTRRSRMHVEEFRPPIITDFNDLPSNI